MSEQLLHVAAVPFEAARRVSILPAGHRSRRLHGHGFVAKVRAELPIDWAPFPGGETDALARALADAIAPLDYSDLN
ncbi:MAG: 6-pyruvoyl tetrahydropterin synthase, partial [Gammaproteobacteria bacterium]|nr:6-pyruvoyl tetrahydropterin synthase [Gammaproteobacteria bacterium]